LSPDSVSERILKIGQHLVKLYDIQKMVPFLAHPVLPVNTVPNLSLTFTVTPVASSSNVSRDITRSLQCQPLSVGYIQFLPTPARPRSLHY